MAGKQRRKKSQSTRRPSPQSAHEGRSSKLISWGKLARRVQIGLAILAIPALAVGLEFRDNLQRSDLSVIGTGIPVVVQAHDPERPKCRSLLENAEAAHVDSHDDMAFRVVNLRSSDGRAFAREFDVGKVTLVVFDGEGEGEGEGEGNVERTLRGVRTQAQLRHLFAELGHEPAGS